MKAYNRHTNLTSIITITTCMCLHKAIKNYTFQLLSPSFYSLRVEFQMLAICIFLKDHSDGIIYIAKFSYYKHRHYCPQLKRIKHCVCL